MAGVIEKFIREENLCLLSSIFNALDKKQQDIITVSLIAMCCCFTRTDNVIYVVDEWKVYSA